MNDLKNRPFNHEETEISKNFTFRNYLDAISMLNSENKKRIADAIYIRFNERYIYPLMESHRKSGFAMVATCYLSIEAHECFRNGWKGTDKRMDPRDKTIDKLKKAFADFFSRDSSLADLQGGKAQFIPS